MHQAGRKSCELGGGGLDEPVEFHKYIIVGAGPGGIQTGYFLGNARA